METTKEIARNAVQRVSNGNLTNGRKEGKVAKDIESETSKMPSDIFLWAGLGCLGVSAVFRLVGLRSIGQFFGQCAAPVLIMGLYNKVVKLEGSERSA